MNYTDLYSMPGQLVGQYDSVVNSIGNKIIDAGFADRDYNALREDTQYQRLVADLEKAGLNKWLAVNGSASPAAGAISQTSESVSRAKELGKQYYDLFEKVLDHTWKNVNNMSKNSSDFLSKILEIGLKFI